MGMLSDGVAWALEQLKTSDGETITYRRPSTGQTCTMTAVPAQQMLRVADGSGGTRIERPDRDFLLDPAELILGGSQVEPADEDEIDLGSETFQLLPPAKGGRSWRYSDPGKQMLRVHTKRTAA